MKRKIRIVSLILALCLLSACGIGGTERPERPGRYVYVAERTEFEGVELAGNAVMLGGQIYFLGEDETGAVGIYGVSASGGTPRRLEGYSPMPLPGGSEGETRPLCLAVTSGGKLAVAEERLCSAPYGAEGALYASSSDLTLYPYEVYRQDEYVRVLNADGSEASRALVNRNSQGGWSYFTIEHFAMDSRGRIFVAASNDILLMRDASGQISWMDYDRELAGVEDLYLAGDGNVYIFGRGFDGQARFYYFDPEGKQGPERRLLGTGETGVSCGAVGGFVAAYIDGAMLYGWEPSSGITAEMLDLVTADTVPSSVRAAFETDTGFVCLGTERVFHDDEPASYMTVVTRAKESEVPRKTQLTYACCGFDDAEVKLILDFNRNEDEYYIKLRDYSRYNTGDDPEAGRRRLEADILSGSAGDIINCSGVSTAAAEARGRLAELGGLLDSDEELKNALIRPVLTALETDGALYTLPTGFAVVTALGPARLFGTDAALSYDAALRCTSGDSELFEFGVSGPELLLSLIEADPDRYIDWESGEGRFDSEDFAALLKFTSAFPAESEAPDDGYIPEEEQSYVRIREGRQVLERVELNSPASALGSTELFSGAAVTGLPGADGGFTAVKGEDAVFAISSKSRNTDAAWRLVRRFFLKDTIYGTSGLSMVTERLDKSITDEVRGGMSEEDATLLYKAIDGADVCARKLPAGLAELIDASAAPYFAGEASAEETARELNRQVSAFFSELG